jgi:type IV pilus assembly protein PilY1
VTGYANEAAGTGGLTLGSFSSTATTATSIVALSGLPGLTIKQEYFEATAAPGALFQNRVTITNTSGASVTDVRYVRVMDWDVPLTEFNEFVTIKGTATTAALEKSHLDGFASSNPLDTSCDGGCGYGGVDVDVTDAGPSDHGAYFRFNFGKLEDGESYTFDIFYGATSSEAAALAAIGAAGMELYSLGQSSPPSGDPVLGTPATFIFGFKGVGGVVIEPVSAPGTLALAGLALLGLGAASRRRQQA